MGVIERGRVGTRCGRGVFTDMPTNTPLHPSQEGNRTAPALNLTLFCAFQSLNTLNSRRRCFYKPRNKKRKQSLQ
jgi:hypothetical protein